MDLESTAGTRPETLSLFLSHPTEDSALILLPTAPALTIRRRPALAAGRSSHHRHRLRDNPRAMAQGFEGLE